VKISLVVAVSKNWVIGNNNTLLWHLPTDLKHFKNITTGGTIIMGRKTFESIGKPLPNRVSLVVTTQKDYDAKGAIVVNSLEVALEKCKHKDEVFIVGGGEIYKIALPIAQCIYLTQVHHNFDGDTFFPEIDFTQWHIDKKEHYPIDEKHAYAYTISTLSRL
jgi:dihydrofolate reductase